MSYVSSKSCGSSAGSVKHSLTLALFSIATLSGCGSSDQFGTFSAEGTVTLNGKPLSDAHVWLMPKQKNYLEAELVVRPQGRTGRDGKFVLTTYLQDDGAPEGEYDAIVLHGENDPDAASENAVAKTGKIAVPMKYKDAKTSGLLVTIQKGEANAIQLDLKTK
jgi:hypothetical protein